MATSNASVLRQRLVSRARLRHLEVLVAVAELGTLRQAAVKVGVSQPGVTKHVRDLEELLETRLFLRHARGMKPTAAGEQLVPIARRMLRALDDAAETTATLAGNMRGLVRVVASQGAIASLLARAVPAFNRVAPDILVSVREADPLALGSVLALAEADLAVCRMPELVPEGWEFTPLVRDRLVVVAGTEHPLARRRRPATTELLRTQTWLSLPLEARARTGFDKLFAGAPPPPMCQIVTRSPVLIWSVLRQSQVLALAPESYMLEFQSKGLLARVATTVDMPLPPIGMMQWSEAGAATRRFSEFLRKSARP